MVTEASLEVEEWLACPMAPGLWSKHIKTTDTYALFYYSSMPTIAPAQAREIPGAPLTVFEAVSDMLFVRLQQGQVVDVKDQDVIEVAQDIQYLL